MADRMPNIDRAGMERRDRTVGRIIVVLVLSLCAIGAIEVMIHKITLDPIPAWVAPLRLLPWLVLFMALLGIFFQSKAKPASETPRRRRKSNKPAAPTKSADSVPIELSVKVELPPTVCYVPFPMPSEPMVGRTKDRERLTNWYRSGPSGLLVLHGRGGIGKSALAWLWMHQDALGQPLAGQPRDGSAVQASCGVPKEARPERIFWYSFEDGVRSFLMMLDKLVDFLAQEKDVPAKNGSWAAKLDYVVDELLNQRVLVVLDAFEHLLNGFQGPASAYQADRLSSINSDDERRCADLLASEFLTRMGRLRESGRIVIVSRHAPMECTAGSEESPISATTIELEGLDPADCQFWLQRAGIEGDPARLLVLARIASYRPLAVRLSIGLAMANKHHVGDPGTIIDHPLVMNDQTPHQIVRASVTSLDKGSRDLLSRIAALRGEISRDLIDTITTVGTGSGLDQALADLVQRGLLRLEPTKQRYSMHGLVRAAAYDRLPDTFGFHGKLEGHWNSGAKIGQDLGSLRVPIERYHHWAAAGQFDQAREFFRDSLGKMLVSKHGDLTLAVRLMLALFPNGTDSPPTMEKSSSNAMTVRGLVELLIYSGSPRRAVEVAQIAIERAGSWRTKQTVDIDLLMQAEAMIRVGRLRDAFEVISQCQEACESSGEQLRLATSRDMLARLLLIEGQHEDATEEISRATAEAQSWKQPAEWAHCLATQAEICLKLNRLPEAFQHAEHAIRVALPLLGELELMPIAAIRAESVMGRVLVAMAVACPAAAEKDQHLNQALEHANAGLRTVWRRNVLAWDPDLRLVRALVYEARGKTDQAYREAQTVLRLAQRVQAHLLEADTHVLLSRLETRRQKPDRANYHLEQVRELAWCQGSPHCYKSALEVIAHRPAEAAPA